MELKIEKRIPIPGEKPSFTHQVKDALTRMKRGDSFVIPKNKSAIVYVTARAMHIEVVTSATGKETARVWRLK